MLDSLASLQVGADLGGGSSCVKWSAHGLGEGGVKQGMSLTSSCGGVNGGAALFANSGTLAVFAPLRTATSSGLVLSGGRRSRATIKARGFSRFGLGLVEPRPFAWSLVRHVEEGVGIDWEEMMEETN